MSARASALAAAPKRLRCAIYTRKSSEEGLEQGFNSLHAQREACEAYVLSQTGEGWSALPAAYDDGGFSGGSMERPGLTALLADVDAGRVDVVVVYKVDRLTRSLADFAKIVERFDAKGVSFVSVTQAFNTTTSMGRLTLNVLLSFAQFEREVTGERIRDKLAASKAKGMWMGGVVPLGYEPNGRTLKVNPEEADEVRHIFRRYLELKSVHRLRDALEEEGVRSKAVVTKTGRAIGGNPLQHGALYHLLASRLYIGEIPHKGASFPGLHPAIVEREMFEKVKALLLANAGEKRRRAAGLEPLATTAPLAGKVIDDAGNTMTPVAARGSRGQVYRYYVSTAAIRGQPKTAGTLPRFPAAELEALVLDRAARLGLGQGAPEAPTPWRHVGQVKVGRREVMIRFEGVAADAPLNCLPIGDQLELDGEVVTVTAPVSLKRRGGARVVAGPNGGAALVKAPTIDLALMRALIRAETWKTMLMAGEVRSTEAIAAAEGLQESYVRRVLRLAYLSPKLKRKIVEGEAPAGLALRQLIARPIELNWVAQEARAAAG